MLNSELKLFYYECFFFKRRAQQQKKTWHSVKCQTCLLKGLRSCQLSLSLLLQCLLYGSVFTRLPRFACSSLLFCIRLLFSKFPPLWIFSSKVWAYFHTAYQNHLHTKECPSLEKYTGYHLQQYHNVLKLRSTGQILLITRTPLQDFKAISDTFQKDLPVLYIILYYKTLVKYKNKQRTK